MVAEQDKSSSHSYVAYGATLRTEIDLSRYLLNAETVQAPVWLEERQPEMPQHLSGSARIRFKGHGRELALFSDGDREFTDPETHWCFEVKDVVRFFWVGNTRKIEFECGDLYTGDLLAFWFIHIFLPVYFTLEGCYQFIHASAVEISDSAVLFTGPSHSGKSTLTDFFLRHGHIPVSDDKVATYFESGQYFALPSHPNHRPYRKFEDLGNRVNSFSPDPRPLRVFYALQPASPVADVSVEKISGHEKFAQILPSYLFDFLQMKEKRLKYLAGMVNVVPVFRVSVPWDLGRLGEVHAAIVAHSSHL